MRTTLRALVIPLPTLMLAALASTPDPARGQRTPTRETVQRTADVPPSLRYATRQFMAGTPAPPVALGLRSTYGEPDGRLGVVLMDAGYGPTDALEALIGANVGPTLAAEQAARGGPHAASAEEMERVARALAENGHRAADVANVLVEVYGADALEVIAASRATGVPLVSDSRFVGGALRSVFGLDDITVVSTLRSGGYSCVEAYRAVDDHRGTSGFEALIRGGCQGYVPTVLDSEYSKAELVSILAGRILGQYQMD
jgi:hypothetical protein